jgi:hypothetical protein
MGTLRSASTRSLHGLAWAAIALAVIAALFLASGHIYASTSDTPTASSAVAGEPVTVLPVSGVESDGPRIGVPVDEEKGLECADVSSFNALKLAFDTSMGTVKYNARVDYDTNGTVDLNDYNLLLRKFGTCVEVPWPIK